MKSLKPSETTLFFNTRDEIVKVKLDRVACFEADSNYCHVRFINGANATILTSLVNIETLLAERFRDGDPMFIRIGKRFIVNINFIFQINVLRQKLVLSDFVSSGVIELSVAKEALRNLKLLYTSNHQS